MFKTRLVSIIQNTLQNETTSKLLLDEITMTTNVDTDYEEGWEEIFKLFGDKSC
jgi:hypothetical protein